MSKKIIGRLFWFLALITFIIAMANGCAGMGRFDTISPPTNKVHTAAEAKDKAVFMAKYAYRVTYLNRSPLKLYTPGQVTMLGIEDLPFCLMRKMQVEFFQVDDPTNIGTEAFCISNWSHSAWDDWSGVNQGNLVSFEVIEPSGDRKIPASYLRPKVIK